MKQKKRIRGKGNKLKQNKMEGETEKAKKENKKS